MSKRLPVALLLAFGVASFGLFAGCGPAEQKQAENGGETPVAEGDDDYNPHDVPITEEQKTELRNETAQFANAITKVGEFRDIIERETAAGIPNNPFAAHQALDKADLVLQWLSEIARNSGVPKENWEEVNTSANDLRTLFEQVHQNIDSKQDPNFAAVAGEMEQKLARLAGIAEGQ